MMEIIKLSSLNLLVHQLCDVLNYKIIVRKDSINDSVKLFYLMLKNPTENNDGFLWSAKQEDGFIRPIIHTFGDEKFVPRALFNLLPWEREEYLEVDILN